MPTVASKLLVLLLIVASIEVIAALAISLFRGFSTTSLVDTNRYQAVFLDNGQVYFGKLDDVNRDYVQLTDIYYLQVEQQVQPDQTVEGDTATPAQSNISLAKLGNELHGPDDEMFILRSKIVFWENLKDDGQVVTAIKTYVEGGSNETPATP
jgi:hypothetical protein